MSRTKVKHNQYYSQYLALKMENEKLWAYIGILEPAYSVMKDKCEELVLKDLSSRNLPDPNDLTIAESSETKEQIDSHSEQNLLQRSKSLRKF